MGGIKAQYDCIKAFSETDFTEDLKAIDVPCAGDARRRRSDRTLRRCRTVVSEALEERHHEVLSKIASRDAHHTRRSDQCRPAGLPEGTTKIRSSVNYA